MHTVHVRTVVSTVVHVHVHVHCMEGIHAEVNLNIHCMYSNNDCTCTLHSLGKGVGRLSFFLGTTSSSSSVVSQPFSNSSAIMEHQ